MDNTDTNEWCICMSEIMDSIYLHETWGNKYWDGCFGSIKEAAKKGIMKCAWCTNQIEGKTLVKSRFYAFKYLVVQLIFIF